MSSRLSPFRRRECVLRRALRDPEAFGDFYDAYMRRVLVFFTRRVFDVETAFDLMSETFAKALANIEQFRGRTTEEEQGWLFAIARSELSHYWRRGEVEKAALTKIGVAVPSLTSGEIEHIEQMAQLASIRKDLADALGQLPEEQRRAVELRVVGELAYAEVAQSLGVSEETARARVSRGLRTLRKQLANDDAILEAIL
jgi:RNA polymerase sigma factor (sigma-70 family)